MSGAAYSPVLAPAGQHDGAPVPVAVVGAGSMGRNHARVVAESSGARLAMVVDTDAERGRQVADLHGSASSTDLDDALACARAVVLASSTPTHVELALRCLEAGVPVLVEKPVAEDLAGVLDVLAAAERTGTPLMCGFVERFNPAVATARSVLSGELVHVQTVRHSPRNPRALGGVVPDLLVHDLDLVHRLAGTQPTAVRATSWTPTGHPFQEVVDALLGFPSGAVANLSASRAAQRKVRSVSIATTEMLCEVDLLRQDVTVYRHVDQAMLGQQPGYRAETLIDIPYVKAAGEPLSLQLRHFLDLVSGAACPAQERAEIAGAHLLMAEVLDQLSASSTPVARGA